MKRRLLQPQEPWEQKRRAAQDFAAEERAEERQRARRRAREERHHLIEAKAQQCCQWLNLLEEYVELAFTLGETHPEWREEAEKAKALLDPVKARSKEGELLTYWA